MKRLYKVVNQNGEGRVERFMCKETASHAAAYLTAVTGEQWHVERA